MEILDFLSIAIAEILGTLVLLGFRDYFDNVNRRYNDNRKIALDKAEKVNVQVDIN